MIVTFARLQRLSQLQRKGAIKRWLQKRGVSYITDAKGYPFTTLEALNTRLRGPSSQVSQVERPDYSKVRGPWAARRMRERQTDSG